MKKIYFVCSLALTLNLVAAERSRAGGWPQFRGPRASGVDRSHTLPVEWDVKSGKNIAWRTPVPGLAHASPLIWGDRVFLTSVTSDSTADLKVGLYGNIQSADDQGEQTWRVLALNKKTGEILWNEIGHQAVPRVKRHTKATHNNSTPATNGERIVTIFGSEGLFCFDMKGKLVWRKDLGPMDSGFFVMTEAQWGFASSPVIHEGKIVVQCDVQTNSFIALFDLKDGREIWRTPRNDVPTWSTPTVVEVDGRKQILVNGWKHTGAYDFQTGEEIWKLNGGGDIPVPTPIVGHGLAYFTSAHGRFRPMMAIRLTATGDITPEEIGQTNAAIAWAHPREGNYMQTPILIDDFLFSCTDNGIVSCFDARTGEIRFSERLTTRGQGFTASPVSDGRHIYFASELGDIFVIEAKPEFSVLATNSLDEVCMATPAINEGSLFIRTRDHLVCVRQ